MGTEKPTEEAFIRLCDCVRQGWPPPKWAHVTTLVAVSGGADSVALLRVLVELHQQFQGRGQLLVAHFHHGLRGQAADSDADFVRQLAADLGLEAHLGYAAGQDPPTCQNSSAGHDSPAGQAHPAPVSGAPSNPGPPSDSGPPSDLGPPSDEATMRDLRYRFLGQQAHLCGARYVAMGHTQDDNVETLLHQLMRGCGPAGLAGMPAHRELVSDVVLIRPLLRIRRQALTSALGELQQSWREDATNQQLHWKRNWIRHQLLPLIESQYPHATDRIANTIEQQANVLEVIDRQALGWIEACVDGARERLVVRYAAAADAVVIHAMRKLWDQQAWPRGPMTETHWRAVLAAIKGERSDRFDLPGGVSVTVSGEATEFRR